MIQKRLELIFFSICLIMASAYATGNYYSTNNSILKVEALKRLSGEDNGRISNEAEVQTLLKDAFKDKSFKVVEQAIIQAGKLRTIGLEVELHNIISEAEARFGGNGERVANAAFETLGYIGTVKSATLFKKILNSNDFIYYSAVLNAVNKNGSKEFIAPLKSFIIKMEDKISMVKAAGGDPIHYSKYQSFKAQAQWVLKVLEGEGN